MLLFHRVVEFKNDNKMVARNLQLVIHPTLMPSDVSVIGHSNITTINIELMKKGLFIQTCIEQAERLFGAANVRDVSVNMVEAPSTSSLAQILDESTSSNSKRLSALSYSIATPTSAAGGGLDTPQSTGGGKDLDDSYELLQDEPSFSETVLSDPGVESMISTPLTGRTPKLEMVEDGDENAEEQGLIDTPNSYETEI